MREGLGEEAGFGGADDWFEVLEGELLDFFDGAEVEEEFLCGFRADAGDVGECCAEGGF